MAKTKEKERKRVSGKKRAVEHKSGYDRTAFAIPDGVNVFKLDKAGTKRIEIVPYTVGKGNPYADEGELHYERTYFIHRNIGANEDTFCSLKKTFGKPCPIDDALRKLQKDVNADEDAVKALKASERQLFNVFDHGEPDKGVQIWDMTYHWFGKLLDARIKNQDEDDNYEFFADPVDGMTLRLTIEESTFAKGKYEVTAIDFKPRKKPLPDELLDAALCLDDLLIEKSYDELKAIFLQVDDPNDKKSKSKKKKDEDDDDDDDDKPAPKKKDKPVSKPVDDDDDDSDDDDEDDGDSDDDDEDEDDEPQPKSKSKSKSKSKPEPKSKSKKDDDDDDDDDDEDEDDEDDDEDDEPAPKSKSKSKPAAKAKAKAKPEPKSKSKSKKKDDDDDEDEDEDFDGDEDDDWEEDDE